jgi:restriction system protein
MIPDYQSIMLPLLQLMEDGQERHIGDVIKKLAEQLRLSADEANEMLTSGRQTVFSNRVHWAKTYLAQAKLLEITRRAHFRITERGRKVLQEKPGKIDVRLLERFPEFTEFKERARASQSSELSSPGTLNTSGSEPAAKRATPDELMRGTIADIEAGAIQRAARADSRVASFVF